MADRRKLAQGLMMMTPAMREDLAGREQDIQRGKTVELLRRAGKEMYENPVVNTAIGFTPGVGDVQAGYEFGKSLEEGRPWYETAAWGASALPGIPTFAGIFAGKGAKTADLAKLAKAEEMTSSGIPREQIWNETGWFQGPDKQWKFEIPDYQAEFKPTPEFFTGQGNVRQYNVFEHPELQKTGYGLDDILVKRGADEGGAFTPVLMNDQLIPRLSQVEIGTTAVKENPSGFSFSPLTAKNINLHELQHAIQYQEGFGKGGSPNMLAWQKEAAQSSIPELKANAREAQVAYDDAVDMGYGEKLINERKLVLDNANKELNANLELANMGDPMDVYNRLAGEVESRLVQKRMQMTPEELKASPPWTMYDVPEEQQIVRFDYDGVLNKHQPVAQALRNYSPKIDEATGLPLNEQGMVTVYHHTNPEAAKQIAETGRLRSAGEPDVYVTSWDKPDTGYGESVVPIQVDPSILRLDDEFPSGRMDFAIPVGKSGEFIFKGNK